MSPLENPRGHVGGHSTSDKPFSSARVILGEQRPRGVSPERAIASRTGCERDGRSKGMQPAERDAAVKVT